MNTIPSPPLDALHPTSQDLVGFLLRALADAVVAGQPLPAAVRHLRGNLWGTRGLLSSHPGWNFALNHLAVVLEAGQPLGAALRQTMSRWLPPGLIEALEAAERRHALPTVLPLLATNLARIAQARRETGGATAVVSVQFVILFVITALLFYTIVPKFQEIHMELAGTQLTFPFFLDAVLREVGTVGRCIFGLFAYFGVFILGLVGRLFDDNGGLETFFAWLIVAVVLFFGAKMNARQWRFPWQKPAALAHGFARVELAHGMAGLTAAGFDPPTAGLLLRRVLPRADQRAFLDRFANRTVSGEKWGDAWLAADPRAPAFASWVVRNAQTREQPADGFQQLLTWEAERAARSRRTWNRAFATLLFCLNATIAASAAFFVFFAMCSMVFANLYT